MAVRVMLVRLQKLLADAGVASRRAGEVYIRQGRVAVNGQIIRELGFKADPDKDRVTVDDAPVKARKKIYLALHKPRGVICSRHDPSNRKTVHDLLPKEWSNLYTVGRLDYNSEGLIFLTNDGGFALQMTHPRFEVQKKYRVTVEGKIEPALLRQMVKGVFHEGEKLKAARAKLLHASHSHSLAEIELKEGKNREVRRLFESQALVVKRLERVQIGPIKLGELPAGRWRALTKTEIQSLTQTPRPRSGSPQH